VNPSRSTHERVEVEVHLDAEDLQASLEADARAGLEASPKTLPPKYLYDDRGCELFDEITRLPEYYPTRAERAILVARADEIAALARPQTIVELGSGTSSKTRLLIDAGLRAGTLRVFAPFDVSETTLRTAATTIASEDPSLSVHAVVGDFEHHLELLPDGGTRMVAFLGSTIGNLTPPERRRFLGELATQLKPGDTLLLGVDLVKARERLLAAYDDAAGVTAAFNRNVLHVVNRDLGADFAPQLFDHVAHWDDEREWIEMRLRSVEAQSVKVPAVDLVVEFSAGEEMRTEISAKFRRQAVVAELEAAGLDTRHWWTDRAGDFALCLAVRP
jgi:L-histidine Nalpha-methyltransferase